MRRCKLAFTNEESEEADKKRVPNLRRRTARRGLPRMASRQFQLTEVKLDGDRLKR